MVVIRDFPGGAMKEGVVDSGSFDLALSADALRAMIAREYPAFELVDENIATMAAASRTPR
jgi:hypothetical protein